MITCLLIVLYILVKPQNKLDEGDQENENVDEKPVFEPKTLSSDFWTNIVLTTDEDGKVLYQYQLDDNFVINSKYLMFHPNFSVTGTKMVQILSEHEGEAVAMLNLWIALNKGLLDNEENFSELFTTSINRAVHHASVLHQFKEDVKNMLLQPSNPPENLEYTEDLAVNEALLEEPPVNVPDSFEAYEGSNLATL